jgi:sulfur dioxygenase
MLVFRQLFDPSSSTYTYLLGDGDSKEAVLIDPVFEQVRRDEALLRELGLQLRWTLETHVHADHITGAWLLRHRCGSRIAVSAASGATGADRHLAEGDNVAFGQRSVEVRATPGHTNGCVTYVLDDQTRAFTGDCLLIRGSGRTDFQQGSAKALYASVHRHIFTLPAACLLYPGHDYNGLTVTSVEEERRFNPRLGGEIGEGDFVGTMEHLGLAHPRQMDIAVPANLRCGQPEGDLAANGDPDWAALNYTFGGLWEIRPHVLADMLADVQVVDVREPAEFAGALGRIPGAHLMPLAQLAATAPQLDRERPVVTVCRSGARSARAVAVLQKAGFDKVANLAGGMLRWRAEGCVVEGGAQ